MLVNVQSLPVVTGRIRIRDDNGPTDELSEPESYVVIDGKYYPLAWVTSGQPVLPHQIVVETNGCSEPYQATALREQQRQERSTS